MDRKRGIGRAKLNLRGRGMKKFTSPRDAISSSDKNEENKEKIIKEEAIESPCDESDKSLPKSDSEMDLSGPDEYHRQFCKFLRGENTRGRGRVAHRGRFREGR